MIRGDWRVGRREGEEEREARTAGKAGRGENPGDPAGGGEKGDGGRKDTASLAHQTTSDALVYPPPPELAARERAGMGAPPAPIHSHRGLGHVVSHSPYPTGTAAPRLQQ